MKRMSVSGGVMGGLLGVPSCAAIGCAAISAFAGMAVGVVTPEVEPNNGKTAANVVVLAPGDSITGTTTGNTTTAGTSSIDYWRVQTAAAAPGIYRYRMTAAATSPSFTLSVRGRTQVLQSGVGGVIQATETTLQTSNGTSTLGTLPPRSVRWFGFGQQEELYVTVSGSAATTGTYSVGLVREDVTPVVVSTGLPEGTITIESGAGNTIDSSMWVYDSNFNAIAGFGNEDGGGAAGNKAKLVRSFAPGTYYVAYSRFALSNSLAAPVDETFAAPRMDFAGGVLGTSNNTASAVVDLKFTSGTTVVTAPATMNDAFDVKFFRFTVESATVPTNPSGVGVASPVGGAVGAGVTLAVTVTPGQGPVSSGVQVSANASEIGRGTLTLLDNGLNGDAVAGDLVFSARTTVANGVTAGTKAIPFSISDAQGRSGTGSIAYSVVVPPAASAVVLSPEGTQVRGLNLQGADIAWYLVTVPEIQPTDSYFDAYVTEGEAPVLTGGDTEMALFLPTGELVAQNDDIQVGVNNYSRLSFGVASPVRAPAQSAGQNGGSLAAGSYYLAVAAYNAAFATPFSASTNNTSVGNVNVNFVTGLAPAVPLSIAALAPSTRAAGLGETLLLRGQVTTGTRPASTGVAVTADLTRFGLGSAVSMVDDGTNGDAVAGDKIYSRLVTVGAVSSTSQAPVVLTVTDAQARTASAGTASVTVYGTDDVFGEGGDAGETIATAMPVAVVNGGVVRAIRGGLANGVENDLYVIRVCDPAAFSATTVSLTPLDTAIALYRMDGSGIVYNDDAATGEGGSSLTSLFTSALPAGDYLLSVSRYNSYPLDGSAQRIWNPTPASTQRAPDGPGAANAFGSFQNPIVTASGNYGVLLNGVCSVVSGPACNDLDFNNDGNIEPTDVDAYFSVLGEGPCLGDTGGGCDSLDFNNDGNIEPEDVDAYFSVLGEGPCIDQ